MRAEECLFGMKVRFTNAARHEEYPQWYPEVGTVGTIRDREGNRVVVVQWPEGATSGCGRWCAYDIDLEPVDVRKVTQDVTQAGGQNG